MKDMMQKSLEYEKAFESDKWVKEIPYIQFKPEWKVKIIPPFCGAVVRFIVEYNDKSVSVYLDCYGNLGAVSVPYWEAYPYDEDTFRCEINAVETLIDAISYSLNN